MGSDIAPQEESVKKVVETNTLPENVVRLFGKDTIKEAEQEEPTDDKIKEDKVCTAASARIRELMKADNFSVLIGAGSSIPLGGKSFAKEYLEDGKWIDEGLENKLKEDYKFLRDLHQDKSKGLHYGVEEFLTFLYRLKHAQNAGFKLNHPTSGAELQIEDLLKCILKNLMESCRLPKNGCNYNLHKTFLKRIISRPTNLRRTNLFTTNYDLVFENAMDEMGIIYVDGFAGGLKSFFRPESFNYDYYYPGGTTEGKVSRMERVLHYYKLHGSLSWVESKEKSYMNVHGIQKKSGPTEPDEVVLIYPTPMKEQDAIGYPYAEMFRRFANAIQQPQSVLVTYGYSFGDAHINRIIYEALSVPSFQLVIVSWGWTPLIKYLYEQSIEQPGVGFIIGQKYANWETFVSKLIPDIPSVELEERYEKKQQIAKAMKEKNLGTSDAGEEKV